MKIGINLKQPGFLISVLAVSILSGFALFSPPHSQSLQHSDAAKNVIKLFKSKPSKKQHIATPVSAQSLLTPSPSQTTTLPVVHKSGALTANETWTAGNVYVIDSSVNIPDDITLTIEPGAIIKTQMSYDGSIMINVQFGGTVNAVGTSSDPIIFTSYKNDAAGGDTNGDGNATSPVAGNYGVAIYNNGNVDANYTLAEYGQSGFITYQDGKAVITHSQVSSMTSYAILTNCNESVSTGSQITDSTFDMPVQFEAGCAPQSNTLERNTFTMSSGTPISANGINPSFIALTGTNKNLFTTISGPLTLEVINSTLSASSSWTISNYDGKLLTKVLNNDINGDLTIEPGTTLKVSGVPWNYPYGFQVNSGGSLRAVGTTTEPIIFTSYRDDLAGGDTNGDGSATSPAAGDYTAIVSNNGASLSISNAQIKYTATAFASSGQSDIDQMAISNSLTALSIYNGEANLTNMNIDTAQTGLNVSGGAVVFRGVLNNISGKGIQACNWTSANCSVDASYTDWGSTGPTSSLVCGQVTVAPWKNGASVADGSVYTSRNCNGSAATPDEQLNVSAQNYSDRIAAKGIDCGNGFQDACQAMQTAYQCLSSAVDLAASTTPFPLPGADPTDAITTWADDAGAASQVYIKAMEGETPTVQALEFGNGLISALNTIVSLSNAYNTCAP